VKRARIIPVLLLQNKGLYKTVKFEKGKYIGDPINAVRIFNEKQCDELVFLDINVSKLKSEIDFRLISDVASECFMPFSYGGGVKSSFHIEKLLKAGVEKVVLNSVLFENPFFLKEAVRNFGGSTIVTSVDVKKNFFGKYNLFSHSQKNLPAQTFFEYLKWIEAHQVGEIMLNVVDNDGTMKGYDIQLASKVSEELSIPVVFCGGCRDFEDIRTILTTTMISAAAAGSFFVFHGPHKAVLINYPSPQEISDIYSNKIDYEGNGI
jgi:cyclase